MNKKKGYPRYSMYEISEKSLDILDEIERKVLMMRLGLWEKDKSMSLQCISDILGIKSLNSIKRIEYRALCKINHPYAYIKYGSNKSNKCLMLNTRRI